ncbi:MAG: hypothetical protein AAF602_15285, partial [Myxococcota bacterium]
MARPRNVTDMVSGSARSSSVTHCVSWFAGSPVTKIQALKTTAPSATRENPAWAAARRSGSRERS